MGIMNRVLCFLQFLQENTVEERTVTTAEIRNAIAGRKRPQTDPVDHQDI